MVTIEDVKQDATSADWSRHRGPVTGVVLIPGHAPCGHVGLRQRRRYLRSRHRPRRIARLSRSSGQPRRRQCRRNQGGHRVRPITRFTFGTCASRSRERVLLGHSDDVEDFAFVDDETGVSASRDRRLIVWNLRTGAIRRVLEGHEKDVLAVVVAGGKVYSSGDDRTLRVWDLATGRQLSLWGPFENETDTCAIDLDRRRAVLGCDDGCIRIFDTSTGEQKQLIEAHSSGIKKVAVSPASGDILSAAYDQRIIIWDSKTFAQRVALEKRPSTWERSLTWSPDGKQILGGTFDGTILLWDADDRRAAAGNRARRFRARQSLLQ